MRCGEFNATPGCQHVSLKVGPPSGFRAVRAAGGDIGYKNINAAQSVGALIDPGFHRRGVCDIDHAATGFHPFGG